MNKKINLILRLSLFVLFSCGLGFQARADIAVIIHPKNESSLTLEEIRSIFLGRKFEFPKSGIQSKPVDQNERVPVRDEFYKKLAQKDETEMKAYWANLIFTGSASPPKELGDDNDVKNFVKNNLGSIGYVDSKVVDLSVKVVYTFK